MIRFYLLGWNNVSRPSLRHIQVSLLRRRSLYSVQFTTRRKTELSGVSIREESKVTLRACIFKPLHLNTEELF